MTAVGFVGLGNMGRPMALNLVRADGAPTFTAQDQLTALALAGQASVALARCERAPVTAGLTAREQELLRLLGEGLRNREIASLRGVSEHAVHQALKRLYRKLGVHSRTELAHLQAERSDSAAPGGG